MAKYFLILCASPFLLCCPVSLSFFSAHPLCSHWQTSSLHLHYQAQVEVSDRQTDLCLGVATWGVKRAETLHSKGWPTSDYHFSTKLSLQIWITTPSHKTNDCETGTISVCFFFFFFDTVCSASSGNMGYHMTVMIICNEILLPLEGWSIGYIYGGYLMWCAFFCPSLENCLIILAALITIFSLQVTQKLPKLGGHGADRYQSLGVYQRTVTYQDFIPVCCKEI